MDYAKLNSHDNIVDRLHAYRRHGWTALQLAARDGRLDIVDRLLEAGFDVNAEAFEQDGRTALQAAFEGAHWGIIDRLLAAKADINAEAAAESGNLDLINKALGLGADVNNRPSP